MRLKDLIYLNYAKSIPLAQEGKWTFSQCVGGLPLQIAVAADSAARRGGFTV
jgi:hypothetical protein